MYISDLLYHKVSFVSSLLLAVRPIRIAHSRACVLITDPIWPLFDSLSSCLLCLLLIQILGKEHDVVCLDVTWCKNRGYYGGRGLFAQGYYVLWFGLFSCGLIFAHFPFKTIHGTGILKFVHFYFLQGETPYNYRYSSRAIKTKQTIG